MIHFLFEFVEELREVECGGRSSSVFYYSFLHGRCLSNADIAVDD
jgi:hypothetical protein